MTKEQFKVVLEKGLTKSDVELIEKVISEGEIGFDEIVGILEHRDSTRSWPLTDTGNALRLEYNAINRAVYIPELGKWYVYQDGVWRYNYGAIHELIEETIYKIPREPADGDKTQADIIKWFKRSQSKHSIEAMETLARTRCAVSIKEFDTDKYFFNCKNGTLDLKTGTLLAHNPEHLLTKQSPIRFDKSADCPKFKQFLREITDNNQELIDYLQTWLGYCMTGETSEQCMTILYGLGANGKSVLLNVISGVLGDYASTAEFTTFCQKRSEGPRNDLAALVGSRFVIASESNEDKALDEAVIKSITGGDTITARYLYKEYFSYKPEFKVTLATNHRPEITGSDHGIWRRIRLIPFNVTIPEHKQIKNLDQILLETEGPGILNWLLEGCLKWQRKGLETPQIVTETVKEYKAELPSQQFIDDCLVITGNAGDKISRKMAYDMYVSWAQSNGQRAYSQSWLSRRLHEAGMWSIKVQGVRYWAGVRRKDHMVDYLYVLDGGKEE